MASKKPRTLLGGIPYPEPRDARVSFTMSRIKSKDTSIEVRLRKALWAAGHRYRLKSKDLPGRPDIVFRGAKLAVFCDSSFWHGRDWEGRRTRVTSNPVYWDEKIRRNVERDARVTSELQKQGWIVLRFWDSDITDDVQSCVEQVSRFLRT